MTEPALDQMRDAIRKDARGEYGQFGAMDMAWGLSGSELSLVPTRHGEARVRQATNEGGDIALPLVLQTDAPNHPAHYDRLLPHLTRFQNIVVVEALGYGFSKPEGGFGFTTGDYADALEDVLDVLGLDRVFLHGPCIEGYTAILFAQRHPERVAALSLSQVPDRAEAISKWLPVVSVMKDDVPFEGQAAFGNEGLRKGYVAKAHLTTVADPALKQAFAAIAVEAAEHGQCYCNASAMQGVFFLSEADEREVAAPSLLVWGEADVTHARTDRTKPPARFTDLRTKRLVGAGHQPELEAPRAFADLLLSFIAPLVGR